jgi:Sec-independent protein secretion pathway component TatC
MYAVVIFLYLIAAVICGMLGRKTAFGFVGHFIVALIITPIGDFILQLIARPNRSIREKLDEMDID